MDAKFIVIFTIIDFLIFGLISEIYDNSVALFILTLSMFLNILALNLNKNKFKKHIQISMVLRFVLMLVDIYLNDFINLPHSGGDSENFYRTGLYYSKMENIVGHNLYGGIYSKIIGFIFKVTGDNRIFIQYVNVVLSILTILILIKALDYLNINSRIKKLIIIIICYFPNNILISALLLRESWIIFLTTLGLLYYIKYKRLGNIKYLLNCSIGIIFASLFHSGVIMILFGIIISEIFLQKNEKIVYTIIVSVIILIMIFFFRNFIFSKFTSQMQIVSENDDYIREAGSRYLPNIYINTLSSAFKYLWIKTIYFIASPTPLYWRGLTDIQSFIFDSLLYLTIIIKVIFIKKEIPFKARILYNTMLISLLLSLFVYAIGTSTAGTAIRHRNKLLPLFLIVLAIIENYRVDKNKNQMSTTYSDNIMKKMPN